MPAEEPVVVSLYLYLGQMSNLQLHRSLARSQRSSHLAEGSLAPAWGNLVRHHWDPAATQEHQAEEDRSRKPGPGAPEPWLDTAAGLLARYQQSASRIGREEGLDSVS